jgi:hypothetical protein
MNFVDVNGKPWSPSPQAMTPKKVAPKEKPESFHRGFLVEGRPPGSLESARDRTLKQCAEWAALSEDEKARRLRSRERAPKPWDEDHWRQTAKHQKVRARPYEVASAAEECKRIAERHGWQDVRIVELKKGDDKPDGGF